MGCCGCFGFSRNPKRILRSIPGSNSYLSQEFLLDEDSEYDGDCFLDNDDRCTNTGLGDDSDFQVRKSSEEIIRFRSQTGLICREYPVKETCEIFRTEDENGNKMINEFVRVDKIGSGSYGKVVLYRSRIDGKHYAIKAFHKSHLLKLRVAPSETAMTDVLREVSIMKILEHPNIVNLIEVIDDPNTDNFYMVLEYVEGKWACEDSSPPRGLGEITARKYLRDIIYGLKYLHDHDDNDVLRRSPGTPVFTAPECCLGVTYHGKSADTWAVGVTLYFMVLGQYPFLGETLQDTYDKIVNSSLYLPDDINPQLRDLLEGLLCKDPEQRMTLDGVAAHIWVVGGNFLIPQYLCWCMRRNINGMPKNVTSDQVETNTILTVIPDK